MLKESSDPVYIFGIFEKRLIGLDTSSNEVHIQFTTNFSKCFICDDNFYVLVYCKDSNKLKLFEITSYPTNLYELKELQMHCNAQDEKIYQDAAEKIADFIMSMKASNYFFDAH